VLESCLVGLGVELVELDGASAELPGDQLPAPFEVVGIDDSAAHREP
jgi:hypothetical protein